MFTYTIADITITSVLDRRRACANGDFPIRIRVNWRSIRRYYVTGKTCTQDVWDILPTTKIKELVEMRKEIQSCFTIVQDHVKALHSKDDFTLKKLDQSFKNISGTTLNSLMQQKIEQLKTAGQIGTRDCYQNTLSNITKLRGEQIPVENITEEWLKDFENDMLPSWSVATLGINMRNIRAMMNVAKKEKLIKDDQYPFGKGKYEIRTAEGKKIALASPNIKKLKLVKLEDPTLALFRDMFLFIYYCNGINVADLVLIKYKDIKNDELCFFREKTKRTCKKLVYIKVCITPEMWDIIKRWGNPVAPDNYIFNTIEHTNDIEEHIKRKKYFIKRFNRNMKIVGATVGIFDITTYVARHSFATTLKRKGVSIAYISESLGHTNCTTTQAYLDTFETEERQKNARLLTKL